MSLIKKLKGKAGLGGERTQTSLVSNRNSPSTASVAAQNIIQKQAIQRKALRRGLYQPQLDLNGDLSEQPNCTERSNEEWIPYNRDHEAQLVEQDIKLVAANNCQQDVIPDINFPELKELDQSVSKLNMKLSESHATIADLERRCKGYQATLENLRNESLEERMRLWKELQAESEKVKKTKQDLDELIDEKSDLLEEFRMEFEFGMKSANERYRKMVESMNREKRNARIEAEGLAHQELMKVMEQIEIGREESECHMREATEQQISVLTNALQEKGRRIHELDEQLQVEQVEKQAMAQQLSELANAVEDKGCRIHQLEGQLRYEQQKTLAFNRISNELTVERRKVRQATAEHERKDQQLEYIQQQCAGFKEKQMHFEGLIKQIKDFRFIGNSTSDG